MEKLRQGLNIPGLHSTGTTLNWVCDGPAEGSTRSIFKLSPGQKPAPPVSFKTHHPQRMHGRRLPPAADPSAAAGDDWWNWDTDARPAPKRRTRGPGARASATSSPREGRPDRLEPLPAKPRAARNQHRGPPPFAVDEDAPTSFPPRQVAPLPDRVAAKPRGTLRVGLNIPTPAEVRARGDEATATVARRRPATPGAPPLDGGGDDLEAHDDLAAYEAAVERERAEHRALEAEIEALKRADDAGPPAKHARIAPLPGRAVDRAAAAARDRSPPQPAPNRLPSVKRPKPRAPAKRSSKRRAATPERRRSPSPRLLHPEPPRTLRAHEKRMLEQRPALGSLRVATHGDGGGYQAAASYSPDARAESFIAARNRRNMLVKIMQNQC